MSQQNGNPSPGPMNHEFLNARRIITKRIYEYLMQRLQHANDMLPKKVLDIVRHLEEGLLKSAASKEEYMNLATLESRLHSLIESLPLGNSNNQFSHVSSSSSFGTMIPTPGMPQSGNPNLMGIPSMDNGSNNALASSNLTSGNLLPTSHGPSLTAVHGGSFSSSDGDGYGINTADSSGSGNVYVPASSNVPVMNNQNLNLVTMQPMTETGSPAISNQSHTHISQQMLAEQMRDLEPFATEDIEEV